MEKHGIGTDATHAEHIETIKARQYATVTNQNFFTPLNLGLGLVEGYDSMGYEMSKPNLRRILEEDLKAFVQIIFSIFCF
jgi:DNA topoisomerase-3